MKDKLLKHSGILTFSTVVGGGIMTMKLVNKLLGVGGDLIAIEFRLKNASYVAYVPDDQLWGAVKDILLNREYEVLPEFELKNFKNKTIVDVGANVGLYSVLASTFAKKVISIEPHQKNFDILIENLRINKIKNAIPINRALWFENTRIKLYKGSHSGEHSVMGKSEDYMEVNTMTIADILRIYDKIDLLKIDVEGAEFPIFQNTPTDLISRIDYIVGEVHTEFGEINNLTSKLKSAGFSVYLFDPPLKSSASYRVDLRNFYRLKILAKVSHAIKLLGYKTQGLKILYALK